MGTMLCPVCKENTGYTERSDSYSFECPRCGRYSIARTVVGTFKNASLSPRQSANLSGWLAENPNSEIDSSNLKGLFNIKTPTFHERADKLLLALEKRTEYAGHKIARKPDWISLAWCVNDDELNEIVEYLSVHQAVLPVKELAFTESRP